MRNKNSRKLWCVLLAMALVLSSSMVLGVSAQDAAPEVNDSTQPAVPVPPSNESNTPDGVDPDAPPTTDAPANESTDEQGVTYVLGDDGQSYIVKRYYGFAEEIVIPATHCGLPVTAIDNWAFSLTYLERIEIPESVTSIGDYAFYACDRLTSVVIPEGVTSLGEYAFCGCVSLTDISLPSTLLDIGTRAFEACDELNYHESEGARYLGNEENPYRVLVGVDEQTVGALNIHEQTAVVLAHAFSACFELESVFVPSSVVKITEGAFINCPNLSAITVAEDNESYIVKDGCLIETNSQTLICGYQNCALPTDGSLRRIGAYALYGNMFLEEIIVPDGVESIGSSALSACMYVTSLHLPASVREIADDALVRLQLIASVTVDENNDVYAVVNNCLIDQKAQTLMLVFGDWEIPTDGSVTRIGKAAFVENMQLQEIVIPEGVTHIDEEAFFFCINLGSVSLPESLVVIGTNAFSLTAITEIVIPANVKSVELHAFSDCAGLTAITFQSPNTDISNDPGTIPEAAVIYGYEGSTAQAYAEEYGRAFVALEDQQPDEPEQPDPTKGTEGLVYTLNAAGTEYRLTGYEGTAVHVIIPATYAGLPVTRVVKDAFSEGNGAIELPPDDVTPRGRMLTSTTANVKLQSVTLLSPTVILEDNKNTIPTGVEIYGYLNSTAQRYANKYNRAFTAMDGLEFSFVPEQGAYVLNSYTGNQTEVTIPAIYLGLPVIGIGDYAFVGLSELTEITLPDSIIYIGEGAFLETGLTEFTVPENVIYIGLGALCSSDMAILEVAQGNPAYYSAQNCIIESATGALVAGCKDSVIPDGGSVTAIADGAFAYSSVTSIVIPDSVTAIGFCAFYECSELESVTFGADSQLTVLGESAFNGCCSLSNIVLPAGLVEIGDYAFFCCCSLTEITIGAAVEYIGERAFDKCIGLTKITICSDDVDIFDDEYTFPEVAVIYGNEGSTAETYAEKYGRTFELIPAFIPGDVDGVEGVLASDAIYLLYNVIFGDDDYPINQPCDFDGNGQKEAGDAIYLLYYVIFGGDLYPLH